MTIGLLKQALHVLRHESRSRTSSRMSQWFKWLSPGLLVKRWLLISASGVFLTVLGFAIWMKRTPIYHITQFLGEILQTLTDVIPNHVSGPLAIAIGLLLVWWGQTRTLGSITEVLMPGGDEELIDVLLTHRRLHRGPRIVVIGGVPGFLRYCEG